MAPAIYQMRFPQTYVQGPDAIMLSKKLLAPLGKKFLFTMGCGPIEEEVTSKIKASFSEGEDAGDYTLKFISVEGKVPTFKNFETLAGQVKEFGADVVIGVGGGRALDFCRGQSFYTGTKICLFPTVAATNASGTILDVVFTDDTGHHVETIQVNRLIAELILVDTALVIQAPARMLAAGIGDCLGSYYESDHAAKTFATRDGGTVLGWAGFDAGEKVFREKGIQAVKAAQAGHITTAFSQVVESIVFNGTTAGCIRGGMSIPHVIADEVLLFLENKEKRFMHGQLVGYGVLPLFVMADRSLEDIYDYVDFCLQIDIPVTFKQLGIQDMPEAELRKLCEDALADSHILKLSPVKLAPEDLYKNMQVADKLVSAYL